MTNADLTLTVGDDEMTAHLVVPESPSTRAMIVIPEAFGLNDQIKRTAARVADAGMTALAIDIFHRSGGGVAPYDDFDKAMSLFEGLDDAGLRADLDAALAHLAERGFAPDRVAIVGFCFGGHVAFYAAIEHSLGAAITFYGGGIAEQGRFSAFPARLDRSADLRTPWIGFFGDRDQAIPVEHVERLREAVAAATVPTEVVRYPDAEHGFDCEDRPSYDAAASSDAWQSAFAFIDAHMG